MDGDHAVNRKRKIGIALGGLGGLLIAAGLFLVFSAGFSGQQETQEAVDVYLAETEDQYVFAPVQFMTEPVARYGAMDKLQIYIALDEEWNPSVVCLHDEARELIQPYIDYLYLDSADTPPEMLEIKGYARPFDGDLKKMVIEGFAEVFGEGYVNESNFGEWFGTYFVQTGRKSSAYGTSNAGFYLCMAGIAAVVICGALLYKKPGSKAAQYHGQGSGMQGYQYEDQGGLVIVKSSRLLGFLGAVLGALLGGFLWAVVMVLGYVSGWLGILIIVFAHTGYVIGSGREDIFGRVASILLGVLVVVPAAFLAEGWGYYRMVNESVSGYISFARALAELPHFMDSFGLWKDLQTNLIAGYGYMAVAAVYYIGSFFFNHETSWKKKHGKAPEGRSLRQINESVQGQTETEDEQNIK